MKSFPEKSCEARIRKLTHDLRKNRMPNSSPDTELVLIDHEVSISVRDLIAHKDGSIVVASVDKLVFLSKMENVSFQWTCNGITIPSFAGVFRHNENQVMALHFCSVKFYIVSIFVGVDQFRTVTELPPFPTVITCIAASEFVVGFYDGALRFYTHKNGNKTKLSRFISGIYSDYIEHICVHDKLMVAVSMCGTVSVWDTNKKNRVAMLPHKTSCRRVSINKHFIVTLSYSEVRVFENEPGYRLRHVFNCRLSSYDVNVISDSFLLISGSYPELSVVCLKRMKIIKSVRTSLPFISHVSLTRDGHVILGCCIDIQAKRNLEEDLGEKFNSCVALKLTEEYGIHDGLIKEASHRFGIQENAINKSIVSFGVLLAIFVLFLSKK